MCGPGLTYPHVTLRAAVPNSLVRSVRTMSGTIERFNGNIRGAVWTSDLYASEMEMVIVLEH